MIIVHRVFFVLFFLSMQNLLIQDKQGAAFFFPSLKHMSVFYYATYHVQSILICLDVVSAMGEIKTS